MQDLCILKKHFTVKTLKIDTFLMPRPGRDLSVFFHLIKEILWSDVVYSWFANLNAFFIVLICIFLHKKSIIVIGGYEVAYTPKINYGALLSRVGRFRVSIILRHANKIFAVSRSSMKQILNFVQPKNLILVYNGVDLQKFSPSGTKNNLVITVGVISTSTILRKGLITFVQAANYLVDVPFIIIGKYDDSVEKLKEIAGLNITFTGFVDDNNLLDYYRKAKVYCQLSYHESFGVSLAEAMACGCVPVVTRMYALPELVGNSGFYTPINQPKATAKAIATALKSNKGVEARNMIGSFTIQIREKKIVTEIMDIVHN
jgi:glycosyltransferase involved in cell wall biosynthesis